MPTAESPESTEPMGCCLCLFRRRRQSRYAMPAKLRPPTGTPTPTPIAVALLLLPLDDGVGLAVALVVCAAGLVELVLVEEMVDVRLSWLSGICARTEAIGFIANNEDGVPQHAKEPTPEVPLSQQLDRVSIISTILDISGLAIDSLLLLRHRKIESPPTSLV
ncbi:hypothetical protein G7Y89_g1397 [Cudoniella acicularis]|uniref:Uncharacterized protein n=1 Tax=Cudoniella acicularis TaxID=354080 RepID=A0A8H4W714_9HELO|nr:hypothetical protein G7Y89_g1397 [Cudoniella acicularis]